MFGRERNFVSVSWGTLSKRIAASGDENKNRNDISFAYKSFRFSFQMKFSFCAKNHATQAGSFDSIMWYSRNFTLELPRTQTRSLDEIFASHFSLSHSPLRFVSSHSRSRSPRCEKRSTWGGGRLWNETHSGMKVIPVSYKQSLRESTKRSKEGMQS